MTKISYPKNGPALQVTFLPADDAKMVDAVKYAPTGADPVSMAMYDYAVDDSLPGLRSANHLDEGRFICRDDEHIEQVESELSNLGAKWDRLGQCHVIYTSQGEFCQED